MRYGFKGFKQDLSCRGTKFEVGITYKKSNASNPTLCSGEGYHYCESLNNVFTFYQKGNNHRFFIIEVLGGYSSDHEKSITASFRILTEITDFLDNKEKIDAIINDDIQNYEERKNLRDQQENEILNQMEIKKQRDKIKVELRKEIENEIAMKDIESNKTIAENLGLNHLRILQEQYPLCHVGGSLGLFLHGVRLKRFLSGSSNGDLDVIIPYFTLFENSKGLTFEHKNAKASANDFDETFIMTSDKGTIKVDVRIDPKQAYEIIEYQGFRYKVSKLEIIWEAKLRYALNCQSKHLDDIYEISGKFETVAENPVDNTPF